MKKNRLGEQAKDAKSLTARTVTGVSSRAFLNASQASKSLAPQGVLHKLGDSIGARFRNASSSPGAAVAARTGPTPTPTPTPLEVGRGDAAGSDSGGAGQKTASGAGSFSPKGLANLVAGMRGGKEKQSASAAAAAAAAAGGAAMPSSSSSPPPLSERAVKGVLGRVFTNSEATASGGDGVKGAAAEPVGAANGSRPVKEGGQVGSAAPPETGAIPTKEPRRAARKAGLQAVRAAPAAVAVKPPTPAPKTRSEVDNPPVAVAGRPNSSEKRTEQGVGEGGGGGGGCTSGKEPGETGRPESSRQSRRRRRPSGTHKEAQHWHDVDLIGSATGDSTATLMNKIRAPLAKKPKIGGHEEGNGGGKVGTDGTAVRNDGGTAEIAQEATGSDVGDEAEFEKPSRGGKSGFFRGGFGKGRGGVSAVAAARDVSLSDTLYEIGLGG